MSESISDFINKAREAGVGFGRIRRALKQGHLGDLQYLGGDRVGGRAAARRLRQVEHRRELLGLCQTEGCENTRAKPSNLCAGCLEKWWAE